MSSYAPSDSERDFLEAVASVFAEHPEGSARFGLCVPDKLSELFAVSRRERFGLRRDEDGKVSAVTDARGEAAGDAEEIAPTFPASVQNPFGPPINPMTGEPEGACLAVIPDFTGELPGWTCVVYLTS